MIVDTGRGHSVRLTRQQLLFLQAVDELIDLRFEWLTVFHQPLDLLIAMEDASCGLCRELFTDIGEGTLCQLSGEVHRDLATP